MFNIGHNTHFVKSRGAEDEHACKDAQAYDDSSLLTSKVSSFLLRLNRQGESARMKYPGISKPQHKLACQGTEAPASNYHLPQVWADYLNSFNPWSWYGHLTFRGYPHPETACKTYDLWVHKLNRYLFGCKYWKHAEKGITWARGTELQRRGSIHFHLIAGRIPGDVNRFHWMDEWFKLGGISRLYPYKVSKGAEYYLAKSTYAWKRGEVDLGGPASQFTLSL